MIEACELSLVRLKKTPPTQDRRESGSFDEKRSSSVKFWVLPNEL